MADVAGGGHRCSRRVAAHTSLLITRIDCALQCSGNSFNAQVGDASIRWRMSPYIVIVIEYAAVAIVGAIVPVIGVMCFRGSVLRCYIDQHAGTGIEFA